ncbi:MAG: nucleotidyltransferase family protein [Bacteroidales bacterium]|jgi:molybdenum cofactor cytidylyltransferase|nr:nucleotidyltransferase family protein [Bacteroidales bacterium]MCU0410051.1 nucleotidyltransferase family protein [Bacteroidales bacterium]
MKGIWGIVLAAGESKRMGSPKMSLPFRQKTIIETVIANVMASKVEKSIVVLGANHDEVLSLTEKYPVVNCFNANYKAGMLSSVKCGFEHLPPDFRAALVLLGDQPMIDTEVIDLVIETYNKSDRGIVVPVHNGKRGHPLLVDNRYREEIYGLAGPDGLRGLLKKHPEDILEVESLHSSVLKDIDTHEDYLNEVNQNT